jgi:thioredoxin reductase
MSPNTNVAIIGAGPYGLSIAAHLRAKGVEFRIFGDPLYSWRAQMPKGMYLKSEGFASNLFDPASQFTLKRFCADNGLEYSDHDVPVPLDTFTAYGAAFQQKLVPELEQHRIIGLKPVASGFALDLDSGETFTARRVIVAAGLSDFRQIPGELSKLPPQVLSHAADHHDLGIFESRDVTVIGAGSSAFDVVASLRMACAMPRLVARRRLLKWNMPQQRHPWSSWSPMSGLGAGWRNCFFERAPMMFRYLPQDARHHIVRRWLGPAGGWPSRKYVEQSPVLLGQTLRGAEYSDGKVSLHLADHNGIKSKVTTDHVIAATGYRVDLRRLGFLNTELKMKIRSSDNAPILSANFESAAPGLYFAGLASATTFGPVMRFLLGARYTARRISQHVAT